LQISRPFFFLNLFSPSFSEFFTAVSSHLILPKHWSLSFQFTEVTKLCFGSNSFASVVQKLSAGRKPQCLTGPPQVSPTSWTIGQLWVETIVSGNFIPLSFAVIYKWGFSTVHITPVWLEVK
jgi:hypothetical protein